MMDLFAVAVILALLNLAQLVTNHIDRRKADDRERLLLKAVIANNVQEFSFAEESPEERIRREELENELAEKAAELERSRDLGVPIS